MRGKHRQKKVINNRNRDATYIKRFLFVSIDLSKAANVENFFRFTVNRRNICACCRFTVNRKKFLTLAAFDKFTETNKDRLKVGGAAVSVVGSLLFAAFYAHEIFLKSQNARGVRNLGNVISQCHVINVFILTY